jgi:glycosyltransferase involved in cell wall biosynthesis
MKFLLLNQTFYPDNAATAQHLTDLAVDLVKAGHSVWVICDRRSYDDRDVIHICREKYEGVNIIRVGSSAFGKKTKFNRFMDYFSFNLSLVLKLISLPKFDVVIGLTSPPWISFFGSLFARLKGGRFVHWTMDINPDQAVELGWVRKNSLGFRLLNWMALFTYKKSDLIVCLDRFMQDRLKDKGIHSHRICVIPAWSHDIDPEPVSSSENRFRKQYDLNGKFVVMYSGNFSVCHPLDTLLETARLLKDNDRIHFLFVGGGIRVKDVLEFKDRYKLSNIQYLPYQPRSEITDSLAAADLHAIVMGEKYVGIVHPCKIYGILASGKPFILVGPEKSHVGDIQRDHKLGYQVDHGASDKLRAIIEKLQELSEKEKDEIRDRSFKAVKERYSRSLLTEKFIQVCLGTH